MILSTWNIQNRQNKGKEPWGMIANGVKFIFSLVQSLSRFRLFATPWTAAHQASLSITNSRMSIELVMPSNHLILCRPLLLLPSIFPSIRVFSNESVLHIRWPKYLFQLQHQSFQWSSFGGSANILELDSGDGGSVVKNLPVSIGDAGDMDSIPELGRSSGGGHGNTLQ